MQLPVSLAAYSGIFIPGPPFLIQSVFTKSYFHNPILMRWAEFGYERRLPWTWLEMLFSFQITALSIHHFVASLWGFRKNIWGVPCSFLLQLYLIILPNMFLLFYPWISSAKLRPCLKIILALLLSKRQVTLNKRVCSRHLLHSSLITTEILVSPGIGWRREGMRTLTRRTLAVQSWVEMNSSLCSCFSD